MAVLTDKERTQLDAERNDLAKLILQTTGRKL
jgi:hypothetical protein